jgi:hypothetical protein
MLDTASEKKPWKPIVTNSQENSVLSPDLFWLEAVFTLVAALQQASVQFIL